LKAAIGASEAKVRNVRMADINLDHYEWLRSLCLSAQIYEPFINIPPTLGKINFVASLEAGKRAVSLVTGDN
jgi:hypothetical protein